MSIDFMILRIGDEIAEYTNCDEVDLAEALTAIEPILQEQAETHASELRAYEAKVANLEQRIRELEAQRVPERWKLVPTRCPLCEYQHGHKIGCENNPVDIALRDAAAAPKEGK